MTKIATDKVINGFKSILLKSSYDDPFKFIETNKSSKDLEVRSKKNTPKTIYRQGDILFKKIKHLPSEISIKDDMVIAEGEATGHAHVLVNGAVFELLNSDSKLYIKSNENTKIIHNEHLPIKLETGAYEVIRQREYLGSGIKHQIVVD
jgi:hypothetical protein